MMREKIPLVSVLMTSYNREKYIAEAIESVLLSSFTDFELIIVDDGSKDKTVSIAREFEKKDSRLRVYENEHNLGDYVNRNKAASYAKGSYLKYLDSDDLIYPWGLEAMVNCMLQYPDAGYGLCAYGLLNNPRLPKVFSPAATYYQFFFKGSLINNGPTGAIIRRAAFEESGGFMTEKYTGDTELWLRLSRKFSLVALPSDLIWWREHDAQEMKFEHQNKEIFYRRYNFYTDALKHKDCPLPDEYPAHALRILNNRYVRNLLRKAAGGNIRSSFKSFHSLKLSGNDIIKSLRFNYYPPLIEN